MNSIANRLKILVVLPMVLVLTGVNVYVDPANRFHDPAPEIANAILEGKQPYFTSANGDERKMRQVMIENMRDTVECITIGPSLTMEIDSTMAGTDDYYNLSVSAMNYNDYLAMFALLELNEIHYDRVILCVDSYFFDDSYITDSWNPGFMKYAEYMEARLDGREAPEINNGINMQDLQNDLLLLFSVTYFQSSLDYVKNNDSFLSHGNRWGLADETDTAVSHYMPDGSSVFGDSDRNRTLQDVLNEAEDFDIQSKFAYERHLDDYHKNRFTQLIKYLNERDVSVELFLCPVCPAVWDRVMEDKEHYYMWDEIEELATGLAAEYDLKITGSYDPYKAGVESTDYYDARHVRREALQRIFELP